MMKVKKVSYSTNQIIIYTQNERKVFLRGEETDELNSLLATEDLIQRESLYEQYRQDEASRNPTAQ